VKLCGSCGAISSKQRFGLRLKSRLRALRYRYVATICHSGGHLEQTVKITSFGTREWVLLAATALLGACATAPVGKPAAHSASTSEPLRRLDIAADKNERDLIANLLAGELALTSGDAETAARRYVDAAEASDDPAVAEQATHIAIASRQWELAHTTLLRWQALNGDEVSVRQSRAMLALHSGADDAAFLDARSIFNGIDEPIFTDDVHFRTVRGYERLARAIASALPDDALGGVGRARHP